MEKIKKIIFPISRINALIGRQFSTYNSVVHGNIPTSTGDWSKSSLYMRNVSVNIKAVCKTGIHESVLSKSVIKNTVLKQV